MAAIVPGEAEGDLVEIEGDLAEGEAVEDIEAETVVADEMTEEETREAAATDVTEETPAPTFLQVD